MSDAVTATPSAPFPAAAPPDAPAGFPVGLTLTCPKCGATATAGTLNCEACGAGLRTAPAKALAAVAALSGLAGLAVFGRDMFTTEGSALRPAFFLLMALGTLQAAWSVFQGRRAGWLGLHVIWSLQTLVPFAFAVLTHKGVAESLGRELAPVKLPLVLGAVLAWLPATRAWCSAPSNLMTLTRRELGAFFLSPVAYILMTVFLFYMGFFFNLYLNYAGDSKLDAGLENVFWYVSFFLNMGAPALTMGLLAEEKRSGTIEILMTAPVTDLQIVLSKFLATLMFFGALLAPTLIFVVFLSRYASAAPDYGAVVGSYLGLFAMASVYFAMGLFISSLTRSQVVAFVVSLVVFLLFWLAGFAEQMVNKDWEWMKDVLRYMHFSRYYETFGQGIIDSRALVYYLSLVGFSLFLTVRSLESRRWA